jgi:hypothetical protein
MYADVKAGLVSARIATMEEERLIALIAEAEQRGQDAAVPQILQGRIGPAAEAAWNRASIEIRRKMVAIVAEIQLLPTGLKGGQARWHSPSLDQRILWRWLIGPDQD